MSLTRHQFLKLAGAAALAPLGSAFAAAPIATREIPKSGEPLPVIGLGTSRVFDVGTDLSVRAERAEVLREANPAEETVQLIEKAGGEAVINTGDVSS